MSCENKSRPSFQEYVENTPTFKNLAIVTQIDCNKYEFSWVFDNYETNKLLESIVSDTDGSDVNVKYSGNSVKLYYNTIINKKGV